MESNSEKITRQSSRVAAIGEAAATTVTVEKKG